MSIIDSKLLINTKNNMHKNYIGEPAFVHQPPSNMSLTDMIIVYTDNLNIKIVPLEIMKMYPIIHDNYLDDHGKTIPITITFCPYSYATICYFGKLKLTGEIYNGNVVLTDDDTSVKNKIIQLSGKEYKNGVLTNEIFRRKDVKIMTLRNAISIYQDSIYLNTDKLDKINIKYDDDLPLLNYINKQPLKTDKTIVYGVEYISSKDNSERKQSVIVGQNLEHYDYKSNGYHKYILKMNEEIKNKQAILIPCFRYVWYAFFPKAKIINL